MTLLVMVFVLLAALLPVAAGVWVAIALIIAIRHVPPSAGPIPQPPVEENDG